MSKKRLKDKKITIYKTTYITNELGEQDIGYKPIHQDKLWAYVRQLSGQEKFVALSVQIEEEVSFIVNWRKDLATAPASAGLYIKYNNLWYNVQRIDTYEGYKQDLQIYAKYMRSSDPASVVPYSEK